MAEEPIEAGWTTGGPSGASPEAQADNVDALYWAAADVPYLPLVTLFGLRDNPAGGLYYGLYDASWTAKPALAHYRAR